VQVVIAALAAVAGAAWLWAGTLRLSAPRLAVAGTALLAAFACWTGITLVWSVAPNQTWIELNRAITYVITLCLAIALGASYARAIRHLATGFFLVALSVTVYGLGQKLFPGLHIGGLFRPQPHGPAGRGCRSRSDTGTRWRCSWRWPSRSRSGSRRAARAAPLGVRLPCARSS